MGATRQCSTYAFLLNSVRPSARPGNRAVSLSPFLNVAGADAPGDSASRSLQRSMLAQPKRQTALALRTPQDMADMYTMVLSGPQTEILNDETVRAPEVARSFRTRLLNSDERLRCRIVREQSSAVTALGVFAARSALGSPANGYVDE